MNEPWAMTIFIIYIMEIVCKFVWAVFNWDNRTFPLANLYKCAIEWRRNEARHHTSVCLSVYITKHGIDVGN